MRLIGNDVAYICGSDEHGVPISIKAKKEGLMPKDIVDRYHRNIKKSFKDFGISFDNYSRTSSKLHHKTASDFFLNLYDNNFFTDYCYRYWLDVNNTNGEYVYDLHPTELASKEWALMLKNHLG